MKEATPTRYDLTLRVKNDEGLKVEQKGRVIANDNIELEDGLQKISQEVLDKVSK